MAHTPHDDDEPFKSRLGRVRDSSALTFDVRDHLTFLGRFLKLPVRIGAIAPSSRSLARLMVTDMGLADATAVVELGPGTGSFTSEIVKAIGPRTSFVAVEVDPFFSQRLQTRFPDLDIVNDSAERLGHHLSQRGLDGADSILSGIPWAGYSDTLQDRLMDSVWESLRPGGRFATFAYIHACRFPRGRRFRRLLDSRFTRVRTTRIVWWNLPPAFIYRCEK